MATNKHAVIRYQALDKCFSNFGRRYYIEDLIEACNNAIYDFTGNTDGVKRRQLYEDINFMESNAGYSIPLDKIRDGKRTYYRYSNKNYSINNQPISQTEAMQLKDTIVMLNRFKGLPQFGWMEEILTRLEDTFKLKNNVESVVSFEENIYLKGLEHFTELFNAIINKQSLNIEYNAAFGKSHNYAIHPYYLKQYNNRWFLFGLNQKDDDNRIMNMAIDRIISFKPLSIAYINNETIDFSEYFDDVVGVTVTDGQTEIIRLKIDKKRYSYIETKPMHPTQRVIEKNDRYVIIELKIIQN